MGCFYCRLAHNLFQHRETYLKFRSDKSAAKGGQGNVFFSFHDEKYWSDEFFQFLNAWTTDGCLTL